MNTCLVITRDPFLARMARLADLAAQMGVRVEITAQFAVRGDEDTDVVVIDARGDARELLNILAGRLLRRPRRRIVVITDETASSEQRAALIDAGVLSAVPANPSRLAELLALALRDILDDQRP